MAHQRLGLVRGALYIGHRGCPFFLSESVLGRDSGGGILGLFRSVLSPFAAAAADAVEAEGRMEGASHADARNPNHLRTFSCTGNPLHRAHGSVRWTQGDTIVLAAVYGPKPGTRKGENPEKASIEVVWKPKTGQIGRQEREYEMTLKRTLQSICLLTVHPNTTTSVVLQVVADDGSLLPCAINASCAALAFAGIPMKHLAVAIGCGVMDNGTVILDTSKAEEQQVKSYAHLVFPNSRKSVDSKDSIQKDKESERGLITCITHGAMSEDDYFNCIERGLAASSSISNFMRKTLQKEPSGDV